MKDKIQIKHSQNFLKSPKLVEKLVRLAKIKSNDLVYEIGPGKGIITDQLLRVGARVVAVEKDKRLFQKIRKRFQGDSQIKVFCADFLKWNLPKSERYKIFSNIPFNLTAQIIKKIISVANPPEESYLIIQEEAAKKFAGLPYGKEKQYSLLLKPWFEMGILYRFKMTDFYPVPKVNIVLLKIRKREKSLVEKEDSQLYRDFIVYGFNQWKSNLKKGFKKVFTHQQFSRLAKDLKFDLSSQPTDLTFEQWLGLFKYFLVNIEEKKKFLVKGAEQWLRKQQSRLQKTHRTRL